MQVIHKSLTLKDLPSPPPDKTGWPWTEGNDPLPNQTPDGSQWPRISIVTPSYNYGDFIEETIRSILLQGYPNLEYIIIDGGSTDNTIEIIKKYEKYLTYWVSEPDKGQTDAINKGFQYCTGDIFAWLNSDDSYTKIALRRVAEYYLQGNQVIGGSCLLVFTDGRPDDVVKSFPINFERFLNFWAVGAHFPQPAVFVARQIADKCFPLNNQLYMLMDYQFFVRVISQNPQAIYIPDILVKFNFHGKNKSESKKETSFSEFYEIGRSEAKKLPWLKQFVYLFKLKDYQVLHPLIYEEKAQNIKQVMSALSSRPTLLFWSPFWKCILKIIYKNYG
ncbi:glycosyltransferase family 2 protein [Aerosakkonemataceae cyanobacterium BLCC-F50]|uniref:Glycosyltransferase family 2 protein n=1 Tax=Floridaenema flaviceps BLCC-F50 TaxID=3153642 RepID=A0ABV4XWC9_9CYAN